MFLIINKNVNKIYFIISVFFLFKNLLNTNQDLMIKTKHKLFHGILFTVSLETSHY